VSAWLVRRRGETQSVIETLVLVLAALALGVAWLIFRLERWATRRRENDAALSILLAFQRGIAEGMPELGENYKGWGEIYFSTIYDARTALKRGLDHADAVEKFAWEQVYVVPTESLELLATTTLGGDLISEETIFAANFALWRVHVFNQLVDAQTAFNMRHAAEILDEHTSSVRRSTIAQAAQEIGVGIHSAGIGGAGAPGGWYDRLTKAVEADVKRLRGLQSWSWWRAGERHLAVADVLAFSLCLGFVGLAIAKGISGDGEHRCCTRSRAASFPVLAVAKPAAHAPLRPRRQRHSE